MRLISENKGETIRNLLLLVMTVICLFLVWKLKTQPLALEKRYANLPAPKNDISHDLYLLRMKADRIEEKVDVFSDVVKALKHIPEFNEIYEHYHSQKPDKLALSKINLVENPSREQVVEYVDKIIEVSMRQTRLRTTDPQVTMLAAVGPDHVDVLLDNMVTTVSSVNSHLLPAIRKLIGPEHKELILEYLPTHRFLIDYVVKYEWEAEAKDILVQEMIRNKNNPPRKWVEAVVKIRDPRTYPAIRDVFIHSHYRTELYLMISGLPDFDIDYAVEQAWRQSMLTGDGATDEMAAIALKHGHVSAVEFFIFRMEEGYVGNQEREALLEYIDFYGENEQIVKWYRDNRGLIKFDSAKKKFVVVPAG